MSPLLILGCISVYFCTLLGIATWTGRHASADGYFRGNQRSPWYLIAFGLIGDSLSGLTFISVPGQVGTSGFTYLQIVMGNVVGYILISRLLLPHFYRNNLTSIYSFLGMELGWDAQKTGAGFFLLSRVMGSAARLYLAIRVFQTLLFDPLGIPWSLSVAMVIGLILAYTINGGIKTLIWTDAFQSSFLLLAVVLSVLTIARRLNLGIGDIISTGIPDRSFQVYNLDWKAPDFILKQVLSGAALALVMNGLDQNVMQKNLSCRSLRDAQRNLEAFSVVIFVVNFAFLTLGKLLYQYASDQSIALPAGSSDQVFPELAMHHLGAFAALVFVIGLSAATFNSADSVLTTLTTSFCVDFLRHSTEKSGITPRELTVRRRVHCAFALILFITILMFRLFPSRSAIQLVLDLATYTYGPLLGLFAIAFLTRIRLAGPLVPVVCLGAPVLSWLLHRYSSSLLGGYKMGLEVLLINGGITALGLSLLARQPTPRNS